MDVYAGRVGVGRHARVVAGVGEGRLGDQQLARRARLGLLGLQRDAASGRVEVHDAGALIPEHGARRCGVDVHGARQTDGRPLLHVHVLGAPDVGLGGCNTHGFKTRNGLGYLSVTNVNVFLNSHGVGVLCL